MDQQFIYNFLNHLEKEKNYISGEILCKKMNISSRTLRNKIKENENYLINHGFSIQSKTKSGYLLIIENEEDYYTFKENLIYYSNTPIYKEERILYLLKELLTRDDYIKIADLEEILHISKYTITLDLKDIRDSIKKYNLDIENKPYYGIKIIGNEMNKRSCLSNVLNNSLSKSNPFENKYADKLTEIEEIVKEVLLKYQFSLTDVGFKNLILHIFLGIHRANMKNVHSGLDIDVSQVEYKIATEIYDLVNSKFNITLPKIEIDYITIHLLSKHLLHSTTQTKILPGTQETLDEILNQIFDKFKIDFRDDLDLYTLLLLHLQPMFQRLKYNLTINNPLIDEIKDNNDLAFEIALLAGKVIEKHLDCHVSVEECGYLALHFALAIERHSAPIHKKNVLVVCASGRGTSQILLSNIRKRFFNKLNQIKAISSYELEDALINEYDMIITTIPLKIKASIPIIQIPYFMKENDYQRIEEGFQYSQPIIDKLITQCFDENAFFVNVKGKNQKEILINTIHELNKSFELPNNLYDLLIEREKIYPTEYEHGVALPHPIVPIFNRDLIVVSILEKPIIWKTKKVKYLFILLFKKGSDSGSEIFNEVLSCFVQNKQLIQDIEDNPSYDHFITLLNDILKNTTVNDQDIFDY